MVRDLAHEANQESVAAEYESFGPNQRNLSPTTHPEWRNAVRPVLKPVACWRVHQAYFDFDRSIVRPEIAAEIKKLKPLIQEHRVATIFGHADPVGTVDYNTQLSARRARTLFAVLTRNVDIWLDLFTDRQPYDVWGLASTQLVLGAIPRLDGVGRYYEAEVNGSFGPDTDAAIRTFQHDHGLVVDGVAGSVTRRRAYEIYIDMLTGSPGVPLMRADQFLGDPKDNENPKGKAKAAFQGCGEYNPILLLSADDEVRLRAQSDKTERNERNAPNRRVMIFFFSKARLAGMTPAQVKDIWPCPAWNEGGGACQAQLWPDHRTRLKNGDAERRYEVDRHTMACSWYDRFARLSPCEASDFSARIAIEVALWGRCSRTPVHVTYDNGSQVDIVTDDDGIISVPAKSSRATLEYSFGERRFRTPVFLRAAILGGEGGLWQRLANMGYTQSRDVPEAPPDPSDLVHAIERFQADHGIAVTGLADTATAQAIRRAHDFDPRPWKDRERPQPKPALPGEPARKSVT